MVLNFRTLISNLFKSEVLFPGNPCRPGGNVEFLENGDMELLDIGITLSYKEFCVSQNLPVSKAIDNVFCGDNYMFFKTATDMNGNLIVRACIPPKIKNEKFRYL